ncbi:MAG: SRPBCC domain-containing protein [Candidatus Thermoplasmatota archaeon]|nr:SRPBCC domain-containing protein [Candidatus Thermoplasmatota archaeon]MBU1941215.1 SRPBCC domain-containing protein [Candidatus Thermoplasmatota archaeon]
MKTKTIHQEVFIEAPPADVYHAFMDSKTHSLFTGDTAHIGKKIGDQFSAFDGYATGENLELKPNKLIVQSWHASDWPNGHHSTIRIELTPQKKGTALIFHQTDVPEEHLYDISNGWWEYYWNPVNTMFTKDKKK